MISACIPAEGYQRLITAGTYASSTRAYITGGPAAFIGGCRCCCCCCRFTRSLHARTSARLTNARLCIHAYMHAWLQCNFEASVHEPQLTLLLWCHARLQPHRLCCLCGTSIAPNPSNMCVNCIRSQVDITEGIQKQVGRLSNCLS